VKMFDAGKTKMIGLPYGEKNYDNYVKPFSSNTGTSRADGQTDRFAISISRVNVLARDEKPTHSKNNRKNQATLVDPARKRSGLLYTGTGTTRARLPGTG